MEKSRGHGQTCRHASDTKTILLLCARYPIVTGLAASPCLLPIEKGKAADLSHARFVAKPAYLVGKFIGHHWAKIVFASAAAEHPRLPAAQKHLVPPATQGPYP